MIGSLVSRLEPSTDCIVWRSHHDRNQDDDDDGHGHGASDDDDDVTLAVLIIAVSRSALGKIRRLLSCHHHLLVRFHPTFFGTLFWTLFWDTVFGTLFKAFDL